MGAEQEDPTHSHFDHVRHVHVLIRMGCVYELTWNQFGLPTSFDLTSKRCPVRWADKPWLKVLLADL